MISDSAYTERSAARAQFRRAQSLWLVLIVFAAAILIAPIWLSATDATQDGPSHFAELSIVTRAENSHAASPYYRVEWALVPNLASEVLVPLLARLLSLGPAIKVFLSIGVLLWVFGFAMIQRALYGRLGPTALLAALFAYNGNFFMGFWNFYFGLGLGLVLFAAWIGSPRPPGAGKTAFFAAATLVLYFCHLVAAVAFLFLVLVFEITRVAGSTQPWLAARRLCVQFAAILLPAVIFFLFRPHATASAAPIEWNLIQSLPARFGAILRTSRNGTQWQIVAGLIVFAGLGLGSRTLRVHPAMRALLIVLALVCCVAPVYAGGGAGLHDRFPGILFGLFFAASAVRPALAWQAGLAGASAALLIAVSVQVVIDRQAFDRQMRDYRAALGALPKGSKLFPAEDVPRNGPYRPSLYYHIDSYAVTDRDGFASLMFTTRGQHIVHVRPPFEAIAALSSDEGVPPALTELPALRWEKTNDPGLFHRHRNILDWPCRFDAVVVVEPEAGPRTSLPEFELIRSGSFFSLYRIVRPARCPRATASRTQ